MLNGLFLSTNSFIAICYFAIAFLIFQALLRGQQHLLKNPLVIATGGIFFSCGLGHSGHVLIMLLGGTHSSQTLMMAQIGFDMFTAMMAGTYIALRSNYSLLIDGPLLLAQTRQQLADANDELAQVNSTLEDLVVKRTAELLETNEKLKTEINARQRVAEALQESEERFRQLAENINDVFWMTDHTKTQMIYISPAYEQIWGRSRESLYKGPNSWLDHIHPEDRERICKALDQQLLSKYDEEYRIVRLDGTIAWIRDRAFPIQNAAGENYRLVGIAEDITERKYAERALQESEEKFRNLVEQTNDWVWEVDKNAAFTYVNPRIRNIIGYEPEAALGKTTFDFMTLDEGKRFATILYSFLSQQSCFTNLEKSLIHKDGHLVVVETSGAPVLDAQGKLQGYRGIARDITERKQVEGEIYKALAKEKELNDLKSRFVSMTSHEFRTPLSTILLSASLLERYGSQWNDERRLSHLQRIQISVKQMTQLLDDVLLIGKAEANKVSFNPTFLDLKQFCYELIEELRINDGHQHTITLAVHGSCHACVDAKLLRPILSNLLSNAIKYSPAGSNIQFGLICQDNEVVFRVQDEGIGIPLSDQLHLFESFHRAANVGVISGTGLGLAIAKKFVDLHRGEISVESEIGVGSIFTVKLPLHNEVKTKTVFLVE